MGFWDFVAPDFSAFEAVGNRVLPPTVWAGPIPIPRELAIVDAWANPFSGVGLAMRVAIELSNSGGNQTQVNAVQNGIQQQAASAPTKTITIQGAHVMSALVIANVYRASIVMLAGTHQIVNVVHVEGSASGQEAAAAAAVLAAWKTGSGPLAKLSSLVTMSSVTAMDLSSTNGGIATVSDSTAGGVASTNSLATRGACALIKLNGGTRSRTTRGRIYYGPLMENDINADGATITSGSLGLFNTAFGNFKTSLSGAGFTLGVASRKASTFTSAGTLSCETTIAPQRRRIRT